MTGPDVRQRSGPQLAMSEPTTVSAQVPTLRPTLLVLTQIFAPYPQLRKIHFGISGPVLLCLLLSALWTSSSLAHATLVATQPPNSAILSLPPKQISLTFSEPVAPLRFHLLSPDGEALPVTDVQARATGVVVALPVLQDEGTYVLSWRVVSADGHPVGGSVLFSIGKSSKAAADTTTIDTPRLTALWLARLALYIGLFLGAGGVISRTFFAAECKIAGIDRSKSPDVTVRLTLLGVAAAIISLGLFGLDALDLALDRWFSLAVWQTALASSVGLSMLLVLFASAVALIVLRMERKTGRGLALLALALLGSVFAVSGHASLAPPQWLSRPLVWLHSAAIALWIGSLIPLDRHLQRQKAPDLQTLQRFSHAIPAVLGVLIASGGVLALLQLDHAASLWSTPYGQVLLAKLGLVTVLLALGALNRYRLTDGVLHGDRSKRDKMRRIIRVEIVIAVLILAVVALWRFTPPPRSLAQASAPVVATSHLHGSAAIAQLDILPAVDDQGATLRIHLFDTTMSPLPAQEVHIAFFNEDAGIEPIRFAAVAADKAWLVSGVDLPALSKWTVEIDVLISDFDRIRLKGMVQRQLFE